MSGDIGFEREVIAARSVRDWDRFRYVDDARLMGVDFGELSRDLCLSNESVRSFGSGVTCPVDDAGSVGGGSCGVDLERKREKNPPLTEPLPGETGISCSWSPSEGRVRSVDGLWFFLFFFPLFMVLTWGAQPRQYQFVADQSVFEGQSTLPALSSFRTLKRKPNRGTKKQVSLDNTHQMDCKVLSKSKW
jgi:hypothetical protein